MRFLPFLRENSAFLAAGFLLTFTSSYGQTYFISLFAGEIRAEFDLSNGAWGLIYTLGTTLSAAVMVWVGVLTDRFRVRALAVFVMGGLALACLSMAAVASVAMLVAVIFALRLTGQGMMSHLAVTAMARWFVATRGRALSVSSMGFAIGQALLPIVFVAMLGLLHWRALWVISAALVLLSLPVLLRLLRLERTPQSVAEQNESTGMAGRNWTRGEVVRHPLFWMMVPALLGPPAWGTALFFHQVHLTEVKGWELSQFVSLMPLFTAAMIGATFASGWAIDRFGVGRVVTLYMVPFGLGFLLLGLTDSIAAAAVGMAVFGLGQGMQSTVPGAFWAEYFGTRHIGAIKAAASAIMVFGTALGPGITGVLIDWGLAFPGQMLVIAAYFALAGVMAATGVARARASLTAAA